MLTRANKTRADYLSLRRAVSMRLIIVAAFVLAVLSPAAAQNVIQTHMPLRFKCVDILQLERLTFKTETKIDTTTGNFQLVGDLSQIMGWLQGYFTALNQYDSRTGGDIAMDIKEREWMAWIYNYCRTHPLETLIQAGPALANALLERRTNERKP
jgi:hypothetical protein